MLLPPPISTRTENCFPYTTLFRSRRRNGRSSPDYIAMQQNPLHDLARSIKYGRRRSPRPHSAGRPEPCPDHVDRGCQEMAPGAGLDMERSEEQTSELQSLMRISYADFCLKKKKKTNTKKQTTCLFKSGNHKE